MKFEIRENDELTCQTDDHHTALIAYATAAQRVMTMPVDEETLANAKIDKVSVEMRHTEENFFVKMSREYGRITN